MRTIKTAGLVIAAAAATLAAGISPALARPNHHKPHQVCHIERHHGHAQRVCHWVR